jgi:Flp pilus assembly protein TadB
VRVLAARDISTVGRTGDPEIPDRAVVPADTLNAPAAVPAAHADPSTVSEPHPEFKPLRRASRRQRAALYIIGPALWVAAAVVLAYVVHHTEAVWIALVVLAGAFLVALAALVPMRIRRVRAERKA